MPRLRSAFRVIVIGCALYGAAHLASAAYDLVAGRPAAQAHQIARRRSWTPEEQRCISALTRLLDEEGVSQALRWAEAIVSASPSMDPAYLALVTAQIRRESRFLATDLEWLVDRVTPQLLHDLGMPETSTTIGPMQVQSWRLRTIFERSLGRTLDDAQVKELARDVEAGVAACVAVLDPIVLDYAPARQLESATLLRGPRMAGADPVRLASTWRSDRREERARIARIQRLASDLLARPLAVDGVMGERSREALALLAMRLPESERSSFREHRLPELIAATPDSQGERLLVAAWEKEFDAPAPRRVEPGIAHDPRVAFILADFNSGRGSCRVAALQALLADLYDSSLVLDGKFGARTAAALRRLFAEHVESPARRADFDRLLEQGSKLTWIREQGLAIAARVWEARNGRAAPRALVPDFWHGGFKQELKGIGRISVEGYVSGSVAFFEDYDRRLRLYLGLGSKAAKR